MVVIIIASQGAVLLKTAGWAIATDINWELSTKDMPTVGTTQYITLGHGYYVQVDGREGRVWQTRYQPKLAASVTHKSALSFALTKIDEDWEADMGNSVATSVSRVGKNNQIIVMVVADDSATTSNQYEVVKIGETAVDLFETRKEMVSAYPEAKVIKLKALSAYVASTKLPYQNLKKKTVPLTADTGSYLY